MDRFLADPQKFSDFYRSHAKAVLILLIYFTRRTFDAEVALDLTAETFASAYAARDKFRGTTDQEAGGRLFTIARRQLAGYFDDGAASARLRGKLGIVSPSAPDAELERIEIEGTTAS
jgi:RNA polymerase sigma-70 factor (ECF subfamily)